jgi:integrase
MSKDVRQSSRTIYDHKWKTFLSWAKDRGVKKPHKATVRTITNFLNWLFEEKGLQLSTIKGYRAAVCRVVKLSSGINHSDDPHIHALIRNFAIERPVTKNRVPKWDLALVLLSLMKPPYEPLCAASRLDKSKKFIFLLALASGARRSELHSLLLSETLIVDNGKALWLKPAESFIAKNCNPETGKGHFPGVRIVNLSSYTGQDLSDDNLLCPVRAFKWYIKGTEKVRKNIKRLFVTCNDKGIAREANKNTLSSWIKHTVAAAYSTSTETGSPLLHRTLHEIRALSSSLAKMSNVAMADILAQCRWAHQTTFTSFYLRDVRSMKDALYQLPPLMAAGAVIGDPPSGSSQQ